MPFVIPVLFELYFVEGRWFGHTGRTHVNALILLAEKSEGEKSLGISGSR